MQEHYNHVKQPKTHAQCGNGRRQQKQ